MRNLNEIECFVQAVELKSLTAAAKALKLPKSNMSRKIKNLEERGLKENCSVHVQKNKTVVKLFF